MIIYIFKIDPKFNIGNVANIAIFAFLPATLQRREYEYIRKMVGSWGQTFVAIIHPEFSLLFTLEFDRYNI